MGSHSHRFGESCHKPILWYIDFVLQALVLLYFSWRRTKDPMIYTPRIRSCKKQQEKVHEVGVFVPPVPDVSLSVSTGRPILKAKTD